MVVLGAGAGVDGLGGVGSPGMLSGISTGGRPGTTVTGVAWARPGAASATAMTPMTAARSPRTTLFRRRRWDDVVFNTGVRKPSLSGQYGRTPPEAPRPSLHNRCLSFKGKHVRRPIEVSDRCFANVKGEVGG